MRLIIVIACTLIYNQNLKHMFKKSKIGKMNLKMEKEQN